MAGWNIVISRCTSSIYRVSHSYLCNLTIYLKRYLLFLWCWCNRIDIFVDMIYMKKSGNDVPMLSVIDDGQGMSHDEIMRMVSFGHKKSDYDDKDQIGRFGVGFKVVFLPLSIFLSPKCFLNFILAFWCTRFV